MLEMIENLPRNLLGGRYQILDCLGKGSTGVVYRARYEELPLEVVALKVLFLDLAKDAIAVQRFRNEMVACYSIKHINVVRPYEVFRDGQIVALSMEYVDGGDLAVFLRQHAYLDYPQIISFLEQIASALMAIHRAGIIHRDLKPENLLMTSDNIIKVADFGTVVLTGGPRITEPGGLVGTVNYVSPEYVQYQTLDERSDIYAWGVIAYQLITDTVPFQGESLIETMNLKTHFDPPSPRKIRKDCPYALEQIILAAIQRNPLQRFQSADELLSELRAARNFL